MIFKVYTTCQVGWVYEVKAKTKKEAEDKWYDGNYYGEHEDKDWEGESQEEIYFIEPKKGGKK